ncbi:hypothetical protein [Streptomyces sp. WMMC1477]|uniref:hypothetical protein n=1 Tax=Streptomyces sp. WMMC1477 TaxID=3015155 RepID=UPI0022B6E507|nr:hypothetical protein [Streptomyces sp. WMMC1477]MCZ7431973.1 hypothetical protein [Streptomyces sp. WMMC1477]
MFFVSVDQDAHHHVAFVIESHRVGDLDLMRELLPAYVRLETGRLGLGEVGVTPDPSRRERLPRGR